MKLLMKLRRNANRKMCLRNFLSRGYAEAQRNMVNRLYPMTFSFVLLSCPFFLFRHDTPFFAKNATKKRGTSKPLKSFPQVKDYDTIIIIAPPINVPAFQDLMQNDKTHDGGKAMVSQT